MKDTIGERSLRNIVQDGTVYLRGCQLSEYNIERFLFIRKMIDDGYSKDSVEHEVLLVEQSWMREGTRQRFCISTHSYILFLLGLACAPLVLLMVLSY